MIIKRVCKRRGMTEIMISILQGVALSLSVLHSSICTLSFIALRDEQHLLEHMTQFSCHSNSCHVNALRNAHDFWTVCNCIIILDHSIMAFSLCSFSSLYSAEETFQTFIQSSFPLKRMTSEDARFQQLAQGHFDRKHGCCWDQTLY